MVLSLLFHCIEDISQWPSLSIPCDFLAHFCALLVCDVFVNCNTM